MLGGRWRPRKLGRISEQAQDYIAKATDDQYEAVRRVMDAIETGDEEAWESLPWAMLPSNFNNRVIVMMPTGDVLVWAGYADYLDLYALRYIGPADEFHNTQPPY